jgi:hypothetical protein
MSESNVSPFSYHERLLVSTTSTPATTTTSHRHRYDKESTTSLAGTVRLETLAEWNSGAFLHPFFDLLSKKNHPLIHKVHMSIASQATQTFPLLTTATASAAVVSDNNNVNVYGLDSVGRLLPNSQQLLSMPPGFFLSIEPKHDIVNVVLPHAMAAAVEAVLEDLIRTRLLTTPVTGAVWDVKTQTVNIHHNNDDNNVKDNTRIFYQLFLPLNGAGWSSDALQQSLAKTIPQICHYSNTTKSNSGEITFFGWSARQWSNFLVGNIEDMNDENNNTNDNEETKKILTSHIPRSKQMWWTWKSSPTLSSLDQVHYMNFGMQYQVDLEPVSIWKDWLPPPFLAKKSCCSIAKRTMYELTDSMIWKPLEKPVDEPEVHSLVPENSLTYPYRARLDQVLRRHHTNRGRFEAWIEMTRLMEEMDTTCHFTYRQVLPKFISPIWQSLMIDATSGDSSNEMGQQPILASVKWIPEDKSSILHVTGRTNGHELPSSIVISLEYDPSFLTLDDFPGDPNRGRELPPAHLSIQCPQSPDQTSSYWNQVSVYSNTLLILPPVPDMSMPFNVISLTSSLYAYLIGTLVTILLRKASEKIKYKLYPNKKPESKLKKLKQRITDRFSRLVMRKKGEKKKKKKEMDDKDDCQN